MPDLIPISVPILGQVGTDGPFVGEVREKVNDCTVFWWACEHSHPDRESAKACAAEHIAAEAAAEPEET